MTLTAPARPPLVPGPSAVRTGPGGRAVRSAGSRLGYAAGFTLAVLIADQVSKAWAWRTLAGVRVNVGGDRFSGSLLDNLLQGRYSGALLDVADAVLLIVLGLALIRWARGLAFLGGVAALAGWTSNLGDRLGLHFLTAPGSARGAVDFIHLDGAYWNVADAMILGGTVLFVAGVLVAPLRLLRPQLPRVPRPVRPVPPGRRSRRTRPAVAVTLGVLVVLATVGLFAGDAVRPAVDLAAGMP